MVASYYVCVDVILVIQFYWYTHYKARRYEGYNEFSHLHDSDAHGDFLQGVAVPADNVTHRTPAPVDMTKKAELNDAGVQTGTTLNSSAPGTSYTNEKLSSSRRTVRMGSSASSAPFALPRTMLIATLVCAVLANGSPIDSKPSPHPAHL